MGEKGFFVLQSLEHEIGLSSIEYVVSTTDKSVQNDFYDEIKSFCELKGISFYKRTDTTPAIKSGYSFAIGWRYIISDEEKLIVFHDSILPRYRGFNPLVTALVNGDEHIGVTALFATAMYDCGEIVDQKTLPIKYPLKIAEAISKIKFLYSNIAISIAGKILNGSTLTSTKQNESLATYSLWRDESDYFIDWMLDASKISRFIDAVGFPYQGAQTYADGTRIVINNAIPMPDLVIENRIAGKVIFMEDSYPIVVCGTGLLKILDATIYGTNESFLPLKKFRTRFSNGSEI
jgi:methionyl-tRNA formyltransferase